MFHMSMSNEAHEGISFSCAVEVPFKWITPPSAKRIHKAPFSHTFCKLKDASCQRVVQ